MSRNLFWLGLCLLILCGFGWWLTSPQPLAEGALPEHNPDPDAGERIFWAGGCASCHATPVDGARAKGSDKLNLGGGLELDTQYGIFRVPNISPHEDSGIGSWSMLEFVNAMQRGVSPEGKHYYPAFPYTSYAKMAVTDVMDLKAYLDTLPSVDQQVAGHTLGFPWSIRRAIGAWKRLYLDPTPVIAISADDEQMARGRMLVEATGHCGECHTPRNALGAMDRSRWLIGGPSLEGEGSIPNITPAGSIAKWSESDIAYYLETGFTPDFDSVGGSMVAVQEAMAMLSVQDREAIAAYLKVVPGVEPSDLEHQ